MRFPLLSCLFLFAVIGSIVPDSVRAQSTDEASFLSFQRMPQGASARFEDRDGNPIEFQAFMTAIDGGSLYEKSAPDDGTIEFSLRPFDESSFRSLYRIAADVPLKLYDGDGHEIDFPELARLNAEGHFWERNRVKETGVVEVRVQKNDEATFRASWGIAPDVALTFADASGRDMTFEAFEEQLRKTRVPIEKQIVKDTGATRVQLSAPDSAVKEDSVTVPIGTMLPEPLMARVRESLGSARVPDVRPILLSFYFAECGPCIQEVPALNRFAAANDDVRVLAVTFDDRVTVEAFRNKHGFEWPVLADAPDVVSALGVHTFPTLVLLDDDGEIRARSSALHFGAEDSMEQAMRMWIDGALAESAGR